MKLLIASHNPGKVQEFKELFAPFDLQVTSLLDYLDIPEVEETGTTFEANARLKAETIAEKLHCLALSDDSGLCVPALKGAPGVYSARYAGLAVKSDQANRDKLLKEMAPYEGKDRQAYFMTCIVVAYPNHPSLVVHGRADGMITHEELGDHGFGYDSLFYYPETEKTFAQMSAQEKNQVSHRSRAVSALFKEFSAWLEGVRA